MMNQILHTNMVLLEKYQPHVYRKLVGYLEGAYQRQNQQVERILLARDEEIIINMLVVANHKEYLLCDHEDPIQQSYRWIDKYANPLNKADIVFGAGFGFHLEVLLTSFKDKKVIVVEPDIELFYQILQVRNLEVVIQQSELFVDESVDCILERCHALLWDTKEGGIQCQPFEVYAEIFEGVWEELREKFIKQVQSFTVDIATRRHFGELWTYNCIKNAEQLRRASNAHGLVGAFQGIPAVLVSAGPSLEKNIHLLKEVESQWMIMAAGTAAEILKQHQIKPHFVIGIDAGEQEGRMHSRLGEEGVSLIYSNQIATAAVESYQGSKFFMNFPTDRYSAEFLKYAEIPSEFFLSGPSVANTCFDILFKMGCNPIILVGQDLAYTNERVYAGDLQGSLFKHSSNQPKQEYALEKDIYGKDVYTEPKLLAMRNWFEGYFEKRKDDVEVINATEGGLNIRFARNATFKSVLESNLPSLENIRSKIKDKLLEYCFPKNISEKLQAYKEYIAVEIGKLEEDAKKQLHTLGLIRRDIYHPAKDKKAFDRIVHRVSSLSDKVMASPIYDSVLKNLIEIDFYLVKLEVDRATKGKTTYDEVKDVYLQAMQRQNQMLMEHLAKVKGYLA